MNKKTPATPKSAARRREPIDRHLDAELFKALSDPTRLTLLACLAKCRRPCSVGEVAECCDVDLSVVSRHLATLARAGVLDAEKRGRTVAYRVRAAELARSLRTLADAVQACCPDDACCQPHAAAACGCATGRDR